MFPMLEDGVTLFVDQGRRGKQYFARNGKGEACRISRAMYLALRKADGTRPFAVPGMDDGSIEDTIDNLKREGLIRTKRLADADGVFGRFTLFPLRKCSNATREACKLMNAMLPVVAMISMALGVLARCVWGWKPGQDFNLLIYLACIFSTMVLHEAGHAVAALAYGYRVSEAGVLVVGVLPVGAYVAHNRKEGESRRRLLQLAMAGIEVQLLVIGALLVGASQCDSLTNTFNTAAMVHVLEVVGNLMPYGGSDGQKSLEALLGVDDICGRARKWARSRKWRRKLLRSGPAGVVCYGILAFTYYAKWVFAVVLVIGAVVVFRPYF